MTRPLIPGDAAPWFHAEVVGINDRFAFDSLGGLYVVMLFAGDLKQPMIAPALATVEQRRGILDDRRACLFTVSTHAAARPAMAPSLPGVRHVLDADSSVSARYGAAEGDRYRPHWLLLDPQLRVIARAPIEQGGAIFDALERTLAAPPPDLPAPVLIVPNVLDAATCRELIHFYEETGGEESGFMRDIDGKTTEVLDASHKRRRDAIIPPGPMVDRLRGQVARALVPMIQRAFQFEATRIERFLVACYDAAEGGHFRRHRDNTTKGTAHRRFACTINLNADQYDGGDLRFPEFGEGTWRAPTGGAVIFSCGLLHEATPVTRGRRYAFLPFLYDEAAAAIRDTNRQFVVGRAADAA